MPVMDGLTASIKILEMMKEPPPVHTKIIVVTAFTNQSIIEKCENIGIVEVIHKPLTFDKLR